MLRGRQGPSWGGTGVRRWWSPSPAADLCAPLTPPALPPPPPLFPRQPESADCRLEGPSRGAEEMLAAPAGPDGGEEALWWLEAGLATAVALGLLLALARHLWALRWSRSRDRTCALPLPRGSMGWPFFGETLHWLVQVSLSPVRPVGCQRPPQGQEVWRGPGSGARAMPRGPSRSRTRRLPFVARTREPTAEGAGWGWFPQPFGAGQAVLGGGKGAAFGALGRDERGTRGLVAGRPGVEPMLGDSLYLGDSLCLAYLAGLVRG